MGTKHMPVEAGERNLAAAQLDDLARTHAGKPWASWKDVVVEWHVQTIADARSEGWIPGLGGAQDPVVEQALSRFYSYHMRDTIARLKAENIELQRKLIDAVECARFYASGHDDAGERAHSTLEELLAETLSDDPAKHGRQH
jgi:hypothetical protein